MGQRKKKWSFQPGHAPVLSLTHKSDINGHNTMELTDVYSPIYLLIGPAFPKVMVRVMILPFLDSKQARLLLLSSCTDKTVPLIWAQ